MTKTDNFRMERIDKLLNELRYEVERGLMEHEIDETLGFVFYHHLSRSIPGGVVMCEFRTRPMPYYNIHPDHLQPRLRVVK